MTVSYISTRGGSIENSFAKVAMGGLAPDHGLYVPQKWPQFSKEEMIFIERASYAQAAHRVMRPFIGDEISQEELEQIISRAYHSFDHAEVAPLKALSDNLYLLELFHGPTLAFKDVAMQFLAEIFDFFLGKRQQRMKIVAATSGDTGAAAAAAFALKENIQLFILYPHQRISDVQRRQMTTVAASNVQVMAVDGSFDDCQAIVKSLLRDIDLEKKQQLTAINSINWARILAQMVYYIFVSLRLSDLKGQKVVFSVPTGNFGNAYAAYAALKIGAPIEKILIANNSNNPLDRLLRTGNLEMQQVFQTLSPSMDIQAPSNFERVLFDALERNGASIVEIMKGFQKDRCMTLKSSVIEFLRQSFVASHCLEDETLHVIRQVFSAHAYTLDPHSAVGVSAAQAYQKEHSESLMVSLCTAHPAKFPDAIAAALGQAVPLPKSHAHLYSCPEKYTFVPNDFSVIKDIIQNYI